MTTSHDMRKLDGTKERWNEPRMLAFYYVLVIVALGGVLHQRDTHKAKSGAEVELMADEKWTTIADVTVTASPKGVWTIALEWVEGPALLKLEADDREWFYSENDQTRTGADGHRTALLSTKNCLLPIAPVGALVGKIGGSSAGACDGKSFVVGKFCIVEIEKSSGPLYLTINDELTGLANNRGEIGVRISSRSIKASATEPAAAAE
jgi:hypothetical protein